MFIRMKVEADGMNKGLEWLHDVLFHTVFSEDRLKAAAKKLLSTITDYRNDADSVLEAITAEQNWG